MIPFRVKYIYYYYNLILCIVKYECIKMKCLNTTSVIFV